MPFRRSTRAAFEVLQLNNDLASVEVCPARGGLVTNFSVGVEPVLFLDPATFADATKSVRGGVPLLFPIAGPAPEGSPLSQHGFARTEPWSVEAADDSQLALRLMSSPKTREKFPHDFQLDFTLRLSGAALQLEWVVRNTGSSAPMPLQFGLHPYFSVPLEAKASARVDTNATRTWDNVRKGFTSGAVAPAFGGDELDLHLIDHSQAGTTLHRGTAAPIALKWSKTFHTVVLWTQPGKPFICVEPWSCPSLPARAGAALPLLAPGGVETFTLEIALG